MKLVSLSRCTPLYIGGTDLPQGCTTTGHIRSCNEMHCIDCDQKVLTFNCYAWKSRSVDYLFLRNNFPDFARLRNVLTSNRSRLVLLLKIMVIFKAKSLNYFTYYRVKSILLSMQMDRCSLNCST